MLIPLEHLHAHPANANVMPETLLAKLQAHIEQTGRCPPLIVRPRECGGYEILDGHHRAIVLRRLGRPQAECEVWPDIDDARATLLLLTLNRLHGEDDPHRRGSLLIELQRHLDEDELVRLLPDDLERIERLTALARETVAPAAVTPPDDLPPPPLAMTFFLDEWQHARLVKRLRAVDPDRTRALIRLLKLDASPDDQPAGARCA